MRISQQTFGVKLLVAEDALTADCASSEIALATAHTFTLEFRNNNRVVIRSSHLADLPSDRNTVMRWCPRRPGAKPANALKRVSPDVVAMIGRSSSSPAPLPSAGVVLAKRGRIRSATSGTRVKSDC